MSAARGLPVLMPSVPNQRWSCHSCGNCCRTLVGHLLEDERARLDEQGWAAKLGVAAYVRVGRGHVLNKQPDGACVFLTDENRCRIHEELGEDAKPLACRIFPFSVRPVSGAWQASLRFDCPSVIESKGAALGEHRAAIQKLTEGMITAAPVDAVDLQRGRPATDEEIDATLKRFVQWIRHGKLSMAQRLIEGARLTTTLHEAALKRVRGARYVEFLKLLFQALPAESTTPPTEALPKSRGLLRQLAFAHSEHVTLHEMTSTVTRLGKRWTQFRSANRFRVGRGVVPPLPGFSRGVTFEAVESVETNPENLPKVEDLIVRYLIARLEGRSVFGGGYYGWTVVTGLAAMWLSVAAAGWLARYVTASDGRTTMTFGDIGMALGMVDRAATRLPALGAVSERARISYLIRDDGLARLLNDFSLLGES